MLPLRLMRDHRLCRKLGISILDMDRYRQYFNNFDLDNSGYIDKAEFENLLTKLLKVPRGHSLPTQRVATLWKQADIEANRRRVATLWEQTDLDGNRKIDFEEFVTFYVKHFNDRDGFAHEPLQDFYRGIRRC